MGAHFSKSRHYRQTCFVGAVLTALLLLFSPISEAAFPFGQQGPPSFADLAEQVQHVVVNISTTQTLKDNPMQQFMGPNSPFRDFFGGNEDLFKKFFGDNPQGQFKTHALGSGFIIDQNGLILTNNHVVEKAEEIKVKVENGKEYDAKVVGRDPKTDIALVQVQADANFPKPAEMGNSDTLRVGDWVIAVGNPFGLGHTVTSGIISAKGRVIGAGQYDDFLQTDAAINPGNSGGPLFNMAGEVVGINTAIVAQGQGIGFAIPISIAKEIIPQLKGGKVVRGWLGVMIQEITPDLAASLGIKETKGALVGDVVQDGPAEKAGFKRGDVIVNFAGKEIDSPHTLSRYVASMAPDTQVSVNLVRDGKPLEVKLKLGTMPEEGEEGPAVKKESSWGLTAQTVTPDLARRFGWDESEKGVVISEVKPGTPAGEAKLRPGDLIKEANRQKIQTIKDYNQAVQSQKKGETLLLLIKRGQNTFYVALKASSE